MTEASQKLIRKNLRNTVNATSSPALAAGRSPSSGRDGATPKSGQAAAHANPSPAPEETEERTTPDTCGPLFGGSLPSYDLQRFLESKLRALPDFVGSPMYAMTWRPLAMPSGPRICQLRARARRIRANDFSGWPTPTTNSFHRASDTHDPNISDLVKTAPAKKEILRDFTPPLPLFPDGLPTPTPIAETEPGAQLNPEFCRWLMGYPEAWGESAPTATRSCRK